MQSILHNPIHTLKTTTTEYHDEAQSCDLEENHDPGRTDPGRTAHFSD